jgi:ubiquinone/menaquinone biosynthesis C-methylase UbiE
VIYQPFDAQKRGHFTDRGQILDFALHADGGRVLDFGPGDGWPSLLMAPMVKEVVGVEGCQRRASVCAENAERLGLDNATFLHVKPGRALPFDDGSFDAVVAASSVEQTPDPKATLAELHRVLRPGGRLRLNYESLSFYQPDRQREIWVAAMDETQTRLIVFDRHFDQECVDNFGMAVRGSKADVLGIFERCGEEANYDGLSPEVLTELSERLIDSGRWTTTHPSCRTWLQWLEGAGFCEARATYDGGWFAKRLFDRLPAAERPADIQGVDDYLRPLVETVITMSAPTVAIPGQWEHCIRAEK